jgi:hypothetical protein
MSFFFFPTTENRKAKEVLSGGLVPVEGGEDKQKDIGRMNTVKNMYSCTRMEK